MALGQLSKHNDSSSLKRSFDLRKQWCRCVASAASSELWVAGLSSAAVAAASARTIRSASVQRLATLKKEHKMYEREWLTNYLAALLTSSQRCMWKGVAV